MRRPLALAPVLGLTIFAAGCADTDPRTSRLQPGQRVKAFSYSTHPFVSIRPIVGQNFPQGSAPWGSPGLMNGDLVNVLADADKPDDGTRLVQIEVAIPNEKAMADLTGTKCLVERRYLNPTK